MAPNQITGLVIWMKADSLGLSDGDPVSTWTDQSAFGNNASGSSSTRPVYKTNIINGLPVVRFDGVDDHLDVSNHSSLQVANISIFAIATWRGAGSGSGIVILKNGSTSGADASYTMGEGSQNSTKYLFGGITVSSFQNTTGSGMTDGTFYALIYTFDGATQKSYKDGVLDATFSTSGSISSTTGIFQVGGYTASFGAAEYGNVDIEEFAVFDHKLTDDEFAGLTAYAISRKGS